MEDGRKAKKFLYPHSPVSPEAFILVRFQGQGAVADFGGKALNFIQQHRLADAAQTGEQDALLRTLFFDPTEENTSLFKDSRPTDQFGWR